MLLDGRQLLLDSAVAHNKLTGKVDGGPLERFLPGFVILWWNLLCLGFESMTEAKELSCHVFSFSSAGSTDAVNTH